MYLSLASTQQSIPTSIQDHNPALPLLPSRRTSMCADRLQPHSLPYAPIENVNSLKSPLAASLCNWQARLEEKSVVFEVRSWQTTSNENDSLSLHPSHTFASSASWPIKFPPKLTKLKFKVPKDGSMEGRMLKSGLEEEETIFISFPPTLRYLTIPTQLPRACLPPYLSFYSPATGESTQFVWDDREPPMPPPGFNDAGEPPQRQSLCRN